MIDIATKAVPVKYSTEGLNSKKSQDPNEVPTMATPLMVVEFRRVTHLRERLANVVGKLDDNGKKQTEYCHIHDHYPGNNIEPT